MAYEIVRFAYDGAIDADGHVLEPATLSEDYLEPKYRERALRIRVDEQGLEYLEIDGRPSRFISGDPDERAVAHLFDPVGADCFLWATDYPHPDHPGTWAPALERLVAPLSAETRAKALVRNVARLYGLD